MLPKYWIISDSHFNHDAIKRFCNRPDNCDEVIIQKLHKAGIKENDVLIHLGDVIFSQASKLNEFIARMPKCNKILVRGNHDVRNKTWYIEQGFDAVFDMLVIDDAVLTHVPVDMKKHFFHEMGWKFNIHGHLHNTPYRLMDVGTRDFYDPTLNLLYSPEIENYKPVLIDNYVDTFQKMHK